MGKKIVVAGGILVVLVVFLFVFGWYKLRREIDQPQWISADSRDKFLYGSVGAEREAGIPYWVWLTLPRIFREYLPGPGGYASLGFAWEEGREMPVGFSKKIVGYARVAGNCASCHAASYRKTADDIPAVTAFRPGRDGSAERLRTFLNRCAKDPRFNAGDILSEISMATKLSLVDRLIYRFILIPGTRKAILTGRPVFVDSTLLEHCKSPQIHALFSRDTERAQEDWLRQVKAPAYPLPIDTGLASKGATIFGQQCRSCHDGSAQKAPILNGLWLRSPYLQNGSVPTVRALLSPIDQRPRRFYQGNDLIDAKNIGFISTEATDMGRHFQLVDAANGGHLYSIHLSDGDKNGLLEYLKTL